MSNLKMFFYSILNKILRSDVPLLETDRLILRKMKLSDLSKISKILNQKDAWLFTFGGKDIEQDIYKEDHYCWIIVNKEDNNIIGLVGLFSKNKKENHIYYIVSEDYREKGYGYEAISKIINFLFNNLKLTKVYAYVLVINKKSRNLLIKLGFRHIKEYDRNVKINGRDYKTTMYVLHNNL